MPDIGIPTLARDLLLAAPEAFRCQFDRKDGALIDALQADLKGDFVEAVLAPGVRGALQHAGRLEKQALLTLIEDEGGLLLVHAALHGESAKELDLGDNIRAFWWRDYYVIRALPWRLFSGRF